MAELTRYACSIKKENNGKYTVNNLDNLTPGEARKFIMDNCDVLEDEPGFEKSRTWSEIEKLITGY